MYSGQSPALEQIALIQSLKGNVGSTFQPVTILKTEDRELGR